MIKGELTAVDVAAMPHDALIPGKGRGDGQTPTDAVTSLKADLKARKGKPA